MCGVSSSGYVYTRMRCMYLETVRIARDMGRSQFYQRYIQSNVGQTKEGRKDRVIARHSNNCVTKECRREVVGGSHTRAGDLVVRDRDGVCDGALSTSRCGVARCWEKRKEKKKRRRKEERERRRRLCGRGGSEGGLAWWEYGRYSAVRLVDAGSCPFKIQG